MKCANCDDTSVTCSCKECGNVLLCDNCFNEIHKLNIFSSHAKEPLPGNRGSTDDDDDDDDDNDGHEEDKLQESDSPRTPPIPDSEVKALRDYISFLETFVVEKLTYSKLAADTTLQEMCETLTGIHAILYDFESKMRTILNSSANSSKDALQKALQDISQYQQAPLSTQVKRDSIVQLTSQVSARICETVRTFHLENVDAVLEEMRKVRLIASTTYASGELAWCEDSSKSNRCAIYRQGKALVFNFRGVPPEVSELVARFPFINYKVEIRKLGGEQPQTICLNMGTGNQVKRTIAKKELVDSEIKVAVGYLDVPGCNVWESDFANAAGFYYNRSKGEMVCTIMNPVLDDFDDDDDDDDDDEDSKSGNYEIEIIAEGINVEKVKETNEEKKEVVEVKEKEKEKEDEVKNDKKEDVKSNNVIKDDDDDNDDEKKEEIKEEKKEDGNNDNNVIVK